MLYLPAFLSAREHLEIRRWLASIHPLWEERYARRDDGTAPRTEPEGAPRRLLRPVYWLGAWQFACLNYYRPPRGVHDRAVAAEPFPPALARLLPLIEDSAHDAFPARDIPRGWHLNTCLVNFYGDRVGGEGARENLARVGEHKDFEPGPVASISLGERALFQFVSSNARGERDAIALEQWLDDGSLQLFAGDRFKTRLFHRVQRVDRRDGVHFDVDVPGFDTRRVNLTFRWVPDEHIVRFRNLSPRAREDVRRYVEELARHSPFFARELPPAPNP